MGGAQNTWRLEIVAADAALRTELTSICRASGHRVLAARASLAPTPKDGMGAEIVVMEGPLSAERALPLVPSVVVLAHADARAVTTALRGGAAGVVDRGVLARTLPATLAAVACGQLCLPRGFAGQAERPTLSTREKQILGMVVLGFANIEIAQRLHLAESTVKSHLNSSFRKLGVRSRVEASNLILNPDSGLGPGILTIPTEQVGEPD